MDPGMPIASLPALAPAAPAAPAAAGAAPASARTSFAALLEARERVVAHHGAPAAAGPSTERHPSLSALSSTALAGVERAQARLDGVLAAARSGRTFTGAELLGLQAEAYRCAQTVDLAAKLVEQGAQSVRQALNTQV